MSKLLKTIKFMPIELSCKSRPPVATLKLPNGQTIIVGHEGGTFNVEPPIDLVLNPKLDTNNVRLEAYDRFLDMPEPDRFGVCSQIIKIDNSGLATVYFAENSKTSNFQLCNYISPEQESYLRISYKWLKSLVPY
jgi:hypothetical protein